MSLTNGLFILAPTGCDPNDPLVTFLICREGEDGSDEMLEEVQGFSEASHRLWRMAHPEVPQRSPDAAHPVEVKPAS